MFVCSLFVDVARHLKTSADVGSPRILVASSSPFSARKSPSVAKVTGGDDSSVTKEIDPVVRTADTTSPITRGQIQKSASAPSGQARSVSKLCKLL